MDLKRLRRKCNTIKLKSRFCEKKIFLQCCRKPKKKSDKNGPKNIKNEFTRETKFIFPPPTPPTHPLTRLG